MDHAPARILVVDDEPSITEFVSYALQKENYTVDTAGDGEQALTLMAMNSAVVFAPLMTRLSCS